MVNGGISLYSLVFKDIWGNVLLIYKNNYVFVMFSCNNILGLYGDRRCFKYIIIK